MPKNVKSLYPSWRNASKKLSTRTICNIAQSYSYQSSCETLLSGFDKVDHLKCVLSTQNKRIVWDAAFWVNTECKRKKFETTLWGISLPFASLRPQLEVQRNLAVPILHLQRASTPLKATGSLTRRQHAACLRSLLNIAVYYSVAPLTKEAHAFKDGWFSNEAVI